MKTLVLFILGLLLFVPLSALAVEKGAYNTPPIEQNLVREGDFAVRLADTLSLVKTDNEADAERALATAGISPKNGWISDFPVTPDVLAEVRSSVMDAADGVKVKLDKKTADERFAALVKEFELPIAADTGAPGRAKGYVTGEEYGTPEEYQQDQDAIVNYYYDEGPPVITYYAPPPDYAYLYAWDPYPFWWGGYWFPGYYVLNDFTIIDYDHHGGHHHRHHHDGDHHYGDHDKLISNRVVDKNTNKVATIDPVTRNTRTGSDITRHNRSSNTTRFTTNPDTRRGAENILRNTVTRERGNSLTTSGRMGRDHFGNGSNFGARSFDKAPSFKGRSLNTNRSFDTAPSVRNRSFDTGRPATGWSRSVAPASRSLSTGSGNRGFSSPRSFSPGPSGGSRSFGTGGFGSGGGHGGGHGGGGCRGGRC